MVMVGVIPEIVVLDAGEQAVWYSNAGSIKIESTAALSLLLQRLQAPAGMRLASGPSRPGLNPGSYKYRLFLNDLSVAQGEVLVREK